jgi:predicted membrane metal-binding protein
MQRKPQSSEYVKAYNASPSTCEGYWGHLGRKRTTKFRITRPALVILFLSFTVFLFIEGFAFSFEYIIELGVTLPPERADLAKPDLERVDRIIFFWEAQTVLSFLLLSFGYFYTIFCLGSIVVLCRAKRREVYEDSNGK